MLNTLWAPQDCNGCAVKSILNKPPHHCSYQMLGCCAISCNFQQVAQTWRLPMHRPPGTEKSRNRVETHTHTQHQGAQAPRETEKDVTLKSKQEVQTTARSYPSSESKIPSNPFNHSGPSFSDLFLPFYHNQPRVCCRDPRVAISPQLRNFGIGNRVLSKV